MISVDFKACHEKNKLETNQIFRAAVNRMQIALKMPIYEIEDI